MGLDWNPLARPKTGQEQEFERLYARLTGKEPFLPSLFRAFFSLRSEKRQRELLLERFRAVSEAPYETLGAPRVGQDAVADAWLRARLEANGKADEYEQALREMRGHYVLDLLPTCDGFPVYTNYPSYAGLDRYSFRAQFLENCREIIGEDLHARAWEHMRAGELLAYADELEAKARPWSEQAGVAGVAQTASPPELPEDAPVSKAHVLFSAIRWCRFWGSRGYGLEPWF